MSISCAPRHACESGETLSAARCQVTGLPQTIKIPEAGSRPTRPLNRRARSNRSATGQGLHLPAWRMQFCIYLSTSKIRNKNSYISWGAAKGCHQYMGGRAFGPPLCRGCAPATPPSKTIPHRPCLRFPSIVSGERSLLPLCCLIPLTLAVPPQFPCSSPAVPLQKKPHRPYVFIPALRPNQLGGRQPNPHSASPRGGIDEGLVKINVKRDIVAASQPQSCSKMPTGNGSKDTAHFRVQSPK